MITLYIITSYLVIIGMMIEEYSTLDQVTRKAYIAFIFSPIVLPMLIGMMISKK